MKNSMDFDNSPAEVVCALLVALGQGPDWPGLATDPDQTKPSDKPPSWPAFDGKEPGMPDNCITVRDTSGRAGGRTMIDGEQRYHYGFQVRVRAGGDLTQPDADIWKLGWRKVTTIRAALAMTQYANLIVTYDGHNYDVHAVVGIGPALSLGYDNPQSKRELFTLNALLVFRQLS
jgi:hypothetical protein